MTLKSVLRGVLALGMIYAGVNHFTHPEPFMKIVPDSLPAHRAIVFVSGFFEIAGGFGLFVPRLRRAAAWGLVLLLIAVFPANVYMATHHIYFEGIHDQWLLWLRLPLQAVLIAWAWWQTRPDRSQGT